MYEKQFKTIEETVEVMKEDLLCFINQYTTDLVLEKANIYLKENRSHLTYDVMVEKLYQNYAQLSDGACTYASMKIDALLIIAKIIDKMINKLVEGK